jgi:hypothetical protein
MIRYVRHKCLSYYEQEIIEPTPNRYFNLDNNLKISSSVMMSGPIEN